MIELQRSVYDLEGKALAPGWPPGDLSGRLDEQQRAMRERQPGGCGLS